MTFEKFTASLLQPSLADLSPARIVEAALSA